MAEYNPQEFRKLFDEHAAYIWRSLRYLGVPDSDLPDQCQEVLLVVHRKVADFDGRSTLRTWIYGICVRVASGFRRKAHVRREIVYEEPPQGSYEPGQEAHLSAKQAKQRLHQALDQLDEQKRAVFVLYEIEGLSMNQVVQATGCPLQTGYSRLRAARAELKVVLKATEEKTP